ncbi:MAG: hypothetical protein ACI4WH_08865 [Oscillospiraceae bacterium]
MYVLIRDLEDNQLRLIHVNEMGYNIYTKNIWLYCHGRYSLGMWICNDNTKSPILQKDYEIIVKKLFEDGKLDLSNTNLRTFYDDDNLEEYFEEE